MKFDIDVSGEDILSKDYVVCIANDRYVKGFKITSKFVEILSRNFYKGNYRYEISRRGLLKFKIRLYSIIIHYLFKSLVLKESLVLNVCKDFDGKDNHILTNFRYFLENLLDLKLDAVSFCRLEEDSPAHDNARKMRIDKKNKLHSYVNIRISEMEKFLR